MTMGYVSGEKYITLRRELKSDHCGRVAGSDQEGDSLTYLADAGMSNYAD